MAKSFGHGISYWPQNKITLKCQITYKLLCVYKFKLKKEQKLHIKYPKFKKDRFTQFQISDLNLLIENGCI